MEHGITYGKLAGVRGCSGLHQGAGTSLAGRLLCRSKSRVFHTKQRRLQLVHGVGLCRTRWCAKTHGNSVPITEQASRSKCVLLRTAVLAAVCICVSASAQLISGQPYRTAYAAHVHPRSATAYALLTVLQNQEHR